jgi:sulfonate transport system substrate-binding protein
MATHAGGLTTALAVVLFGLFVASARASETLPLDAPIPDTVPPGTVLRFGGQHDLEFKLSGEADKLPFKLEFVNISGGPGTINAFHAKALDVGFSNDIPAIQAIWLGLDVRIVAFRQRLDPEMPAFQFGIAPKAHIASLADLRGKKIAFSPGQAQGSVVLRTLKQYGIRKDEVELVELPSSGPAYLNALAANLVDAAPLSQIPIKRYAEDYAKDGGKVLPPYGIKDNPIILWVRTETLKDPGKAAALKLFLQAWARSQRWIDTHQDRWIDAWYVKDQGVSPDDGRFLESLIGRPDIPQDWSGALRDEQETIDFLAQETGHKPFDAASLFDRRFETLSGAAYATAKP